MSNFIDPTKVKTTLTAGATITPIDLVTHVAGTGAIANIVNPDSAGLIGQPFNNFLFLVADGAWTTVTTGNIANAITAVAGTAYIAIWEGNKWWIK